MDGFNKLNNFNGNKYLAGIALLMLNIGSKYLIIDISKSTQNLLKLKIIRRFTIFSIFFIGTRNIIISLILTGVFIVFSNGLFNENSKFCILPEQLKEEHISKDEYDNALDVINKYETYNNLNNNIKQKNNEKKMNYLELKKSL
tara:strand:- start:276 stop:707 length:432 start_codon:yes stop_codon:yes gene_type:complete